MKVCMKEYQNFISTTFPNLFEIIYATGSCYCRYTQGFSPPAVKYQKDDKPFTRSTRELTSNSQF